MALARGYATARHRLALVYHEIVSCVYSLEWSRRGYSNWYTQRTIIV